MLTERLQEFIDYKGINISAFEKSIGLANNAIRKKIAHSRSNMGTETLKSILQVYPELSADWLLLGQGSMLRDNNKDSISETQTKENKDIQAANLSDALQIINKQQDTIIELTKTLTILIEKHK